VKLCRYQAPRLLEIHFFAPVERYVHVQHADKERSFCWLCYGLNCWFKKRCFHA
jgi:hypothetical protein